MITRAENEIKITISDEVINNQINQSLVAASCCCSSISFLPTSSCISIYLATHLSIQTVSPFVRSGSWNRVGMHFLKQVFVNLIET